MNTFVCKVCGHIAFGEAPDNCPVCGAPKTSFIITPDAIKKPADLNNLTEGDKKHIPVITVSKTCGLAGPGCTDVTVKTGEILHVMEEKHFIVYIDLYHDHKFIARYHMTPALNPIITAHLKVAEGVFTALEFCNIHGKWMSEVKL